MDRIEILELYVSAALFLKVRIIPLPGAKTLPFFIQDAYQLYEMHIANQSCAVLFESNPDNSPASISKHLNVVQDSLSIPCVYVCDALTSYNRERLIKHHVPFIVPGNQMYLPFLGIDLREYFLKKRLILDKIEKLSPAAQLTLIYIMLSESTTFRPAELAEGTAYTTMTTSRAVDELEEAKLITSKRIGRERVLSIDMEKSDLWNKAVPLMQSPVKQKVFLRLGVIDTKKYMKSGYSALADYSSLNNPVNPVVAMSNDDWKLLQLKGVKPVEFGEVEVELWQYNPEIFADNGCVNRFLLYLSLKDDKDERIEITLEEMMEGTTNDSNSRFRSVSQTFR